MSIEIARVKLSSPAQRAFQSAGIITLEELAEHTEAEIAGLHGVGPKVMRILRDTLRENGLGFASPKQTS